MLHQEVSIQLLLTKTISNINSNKKRTPTAITTTTASTTTKQPQYNWDVTSS